MVINTVTNRFAGNDWGDECNERYRQEQRDLLPGVRNADCFTIAYDTICPDARNTPQENPCYPHKCVTLSRPFNVQRGHTSTVRACVCVCAAKPFRSVPA